MGNGSNPRRGVVFLLALLLVGGGCESSPEPVPTPPGENGGQGGPGDGSNGGKNGDSAPGEGGSISELASTEIFNSCSARSALPNIAVLMLRATHARDIFGACPIAAPNNPYARRTSLGLNTKRARGLSD